MVINLRKSKKTKITTIEGDVTISLKTISRNLMMGRQSPNRGLRLQPFRKSRRTRTTIRGATTAEVEEVADKKTSSSKEKRINAR